MTDKQGRLYLVPGPLAGTNLPQVVSSDDLEIIKRLDLYLVENAKTARQFIKSIDSEFKIQDIEVIQLDKHGNNKELIADFLSKIISGRNAGLMSECGIPGVADPGSEAVSMAHEKDIRVVPISGPSSIFLALAASGLNGQSFTFHGYLPKEKEERIRKIKDLSTLVVKQKSTQIFIETPYRNESLLHDLIQHANPEIRLCIASGIASLDEYIMTRRINNWFKSQLPKLKDIPTVFLLG